MKKNIAQYLWIALLPMILACAKIEKKPISESESHSEKPIFAQKFEFLNDGVRVTEPWPGALKAIDYHFEKAPERIVVTSTTHLPYLELLGLENKVVGFPSTQYISSEKFRNLVANGQITDLGPDGQINLELLIGVRPDVVFAFDMGSESASLDKIKEAGIQVIYDADFLETSALGKAEWIRFFGKIFHLESRADSIFQGIAQRYDSLKSLTKNITSRPTIMSGVMYGDTWFLPAGKNWAAGFYADAGGDYLWSSSEGSDWLEISFESVFDIANDADFWIGISTFQSKAELQSQDQRYAAFSAFGEDRLYNYNKRISPTGGYDFFESANARPDLVLADLITILHPELMPDYETYYFLKLP